MPVNEQTVDAVNIDNVKTIAGGPAFYASLAMGNAVAHANRVNAIAEAAYGKITEMIITTDVSEAAALTALAQQASKSAGNTPPVTP